VPQYSPVVKIQTLPEELHSAAIALWHETGLTRPWNDPTTDLQRAVEGPGSTVLAAVDGETLVATVMVGHDGHRGWVYYLAVDPAAQGQGLGRQMMQASEDWILGQRIPKLQLMVRSDNAAAIGFYAKLGYTDAAVVVLGKRLDSPQ
jgi:ribosomal protein S18 acetylase RimI-like enzyme